MYNLLSTLEFPGFRGLQGPGGHILFLVTYDLQFFNSVL